MIISDRDVFVGAHVTDEVKEKLREEAARRKMSMSALIAEIVEKYLAAPKDASGDRRRSNRRGPNLINPNEADVPLPLTET